MIKEFVNFLNNGDELTVNFSFKMFDKISMNDYIWSDFKQFVPHFLSVFWPLFVYVCRQIKFYI